MKPGARGGVGKGDEPSGDVRSGAVRRGRVTCGYRRSRKVGRATAGHRGVGGGVMWGGAGFSGSPDERPAFLHVSRGSCQSLVGSGSVRVAAFEGREHVRMHCKSRGCGETGGRGLGRGRGAVFGGCAERLPEGATGGAAGWPVAGAGLVKYQGRIRRKCRGKVSGQSVGPKCLAKAGSCGDRWKSHAGSSYVRRFRG